MLLAFLFFALFIFLFYIPFSLFHLFYNALERRILAFFPLMRAEFKPNSPLHIIERRKTRKFLLSRTNSDIREFNGRLPYQHPPVCSLPLISASSCLQHPFVFNAYLNKIPQLSVSIENSYPKQ